MLSAVLGLFSQDLAVDLGSSRTRIYLRGAGVICDEPSVVTVQTRKDGRRRVVSVGDGALPMLGRTPSDLDAIQPVRAGSISDYEVAEALLLQLVKRSHRSTGLVRPRMTVALPSRAGDMAVRALRESCEAAGAREVHLVPRAIAAAMGAELPVHEPNGHMIVDFGGSATEVSVLSLGGIVHSAVVEGGGEGLDQAIIDYVRRHHATEIGRPTAERLKLELGSARLGGTSGSRTAKGRCLRLGIPRAVTVDAADVQTAIAPHVAAIAEAITTAVETIAPELASDIVGNGVILVGGGAGLDSLEAALRHLTGLPVMCADRPSEAVVRGMGALFDEQELLHTIAS